MNPQQQRIAIAEACGWRRVLPGIPGDAWLDPKEKYIRIKRIPDYLNDLNACHEMESTLEQCEINWKTYREILEAKLTHHLALHATAAQRAEAFLKTIGKWEEQSK